MTNKEIFEVMSTLKKDVPKKPFMTYSKEGKSVGICSNCGNEIYTSYKYCPECGQKIDWGKVE